MQTVHPHATHAPVLFPTDVVAALAVALLRRVELHLVTRWIVRVGWYRDCCKENYHIIWIVASSIDKIRPGLVRE